MKQLRHDNDDDTWQTIGLATARLLVKLGNEHQRDGQERAERENAEKEKRESERAYIEQRLKDIERFEARYLRKRS